MEPLKPPASLLPAGACDWVTVENLAIAVRKDVRTVLGWCDNGLVYCVGLAGGYGGRWVAVADGCWPVSGPGVAAYRERRSASARIGGVQGAVKGYQFAVPRRDGGSRA